MPDLGSPLPSADSTTTRASAGVVALVVWALAAVYAGAYLLQGWVPHDAGALGQSAERVARGELPHRDFDAIYTGGLACVNALAFAIHGPSVASLRGVVFLAFLAWVPAVYALAARLTTPLHAALVTWLCVAWSLPNYPEAIPSWFNLFAATWGALALVWHARDPRARWLILAGACAGLSLLAKIAGLYFVAALALVLLTREQDMARASDAPVTGAGARAYSWFLALGLCGFVAGVARLTWGSLDRAVHFTLPAAALVAAVVSREVPLWRRPRADRFLALSRLAAPALIGLVLVLGPWLFVYAACGALDDLYRGLFVLPRRRLEGAAFAFPDVMRGGGLGLACLAVWWSERVGQRWRPAWVAVGLALALGVGFRGDHPGLYRVVFDGMRVAIPLVVVLGCGWLIRSEHGVAQPEPERGAALFVLLACAGCCGLVQFPFAAPIYFFYAAPLAALGGLALATRAGPRPSPLFGALVLGGLLFSVHWVNTTSIYDMGLRFRPNPQTAWLDLPRGGVRVSEGERDEYTALVAALTALDAGQGERPDLLALPDCPEVYFLAGLVNPTRTLFDIFDDPAQPALPERLEQLAVRIVVINQAPQFTPPLPERVLGLVRARYPRSTQAGRFEIRWR